MEFSFYSETSSGITKCQLFSQAIQFGVSVLLSCKGTVAALHKILDLS